MELNASPPKVERQEDKIIISFSVGEFPVCLAFSERQELIEAVKADGARV